MFRDACILCALKHIAQARVLALETKKGYVEHYWYAMGHLGEAEDELIKEFPDLVELIRVERKNWEHDPFSIPDWKHLVLTISKAGGYDLEAELVETNRETLV